MNLKNLFDIPAHRPRSHPVASNVGSLRRSACMTALVLAFAASPLVAGSAGTLDPNFGVGGRLTIDFDHSTDIAHAVAVQPDGKLVLVGTTYMNNDFSQEDFAVSRHNPDGSLDTTF